ncbi:MAG: branched-chain amino acid ABC transporter permease [Clostridiales bacterium]
MKDLTIQLLIDGLTLGFVYSIIAVGYSLVYGILEFINFANSEIFMVGAFIGAEVLIILQKVGILGNIPIPIALFIAITISVILSGSLGVLIDKVAYKPIRNSPKLVAFISAIGVSFFLQDAVRIIEAVWKNAFYVNAPDVLTYKIKFSDNTNIPVKFLFIVGSSIFVMGIVTLFINKTKWGKAMRAVAQDSTTASLMGINTEKMISMTFFIGAALGGFAGTLFTIQYSLVHPYVGFVLGIKSFTAAVFGGIGNLPGAMLGGIILGLIETFGSAFLSNLTNGIIGSEYKDVFAFSILILILIFKPNGLLGSTVKEKV